MTDPQLMTRFDAAGMDSADSWPGHMADLVGATYGPTPMASMTVTADELLVKGTLGTFRLDKGSVRKVGSGRMYPWFFRAVRIRGTCGNQDVDIQFKPLSVTHRAILQRLRALGYAT